MPASRPSALCVVSELESAMFSAAHHQKVTPAAVSRSPRLLSPGSWCDSVLARAMARLCWCALSCRCELHLSGRTPAARRELLMESNTAWATWAASGNAAVVGDCGCGEALGPAGWVVRPDDECPDGVGACLVSAGALVGAWLGCLPDARVLDDGGTIGAVVGSAASGNVDASSRLGRKPVGAAVEPACPGSVTRASRSRAKKTVLAAAMSARFSLVVPSLRRRFCAPDAARCRGTCCMDIWLTPRCGPPHGKPDADRVCQIGLFSRGLLRRGSCSSRYLRRLSRWVEPARVSRVRSPACGISYLSTGASTRSEQTTSTR